MARGREKAAVQTAPVEGPWELPEGWRWERLGSLADLIRGVSYKKSQAWEVPQHNTVRLLRGNNIQAGRIIERDITHVDQGCVKNEQLLRVSDIVLTMSSGSASLVGKSAFLEASLPNTTFGAFCACIRTRNPANARWIFHFLQTDFYRAYIVDAAKGTNINNLSAAHVLQLPVPVPDASIQSRIVARIDELFSELDDGETALARAREDLEVYRKALLKAAVTGELTADWRAANPPKETGEQLLKRILAERRARWEADPKNKGKRYKEPAAPDTSGLPELPEGWAWAKAPQLLEWSSGKFLPENQMRPGNVPVYGGNGIAGYHEAALTSCRTLIIGRVGYYCGNAHSSNGPAWVTDNAIYASEISEIVSVEYLKLVFESANLRERSQGGAQPFVSQKMLNEVWLPLPGSEEQLQIAQHYEFQIMATASLADNIGGNVSSELRQSILAAAFKGELIQ